MLSLMEEHSLQPRDALHLATMHANNISLIVSEDKDFDNISFIERRSVLSLAL